MKTLLIPIDFSETSDVAVDFGLQLAEKCGYQIILHHSIDLPQAYGSLQRSSVHMQAFEEALVEEMKVKLDNLQRKYRRIGLKITKQLTRGLLVEDIKKLVNTKKVNLIVMGTKGVSGLKEFFIGSNTEKVGRLVDCPVISVPVKINIDEIKRILVPVDLDLIQPSFFRQIPLFQQLFSASVEFVWVRSPHIHVKDDLLVEEFENLIETYGINHSWFTILRDVVPDEGIAMYANEIDADMLAMTTHSRKGLSHFFFGSTTEDVLNHTKILLWSLKLNENEELIELENYRNNALISI